MKKLIFSAALLLVLATSDIASAQFRAGIRIGGGGPYYGGYGSGYGSARIGGFGASYGNWGYAPYGYGYNRGWSGYGYNRGWGGYGYNPGGGYANRYVYGAPNYYSQPNYYQPGYDTGPSVVGPAETAAPAPVTMTVMVPKPDAQVFVNGTATTSKGTERNFESRPLEPGASYTYTLTAKWMEKGKMVERTRELSVEPGRTFMIDFRDEDN